MSENSDSSQGSEPNVDKFKIAYVEDKSGKSIYFSPTSDKSFKIRFTGHHLKWIWKVEGTTHRPPLKTVKMKHWRKYIYDWKGATIVLNPKTFELWLKSRPYKSVERMIYSNWNKADLYAREFSEFANIALQPIHTPHPADIDKAHLVMTTKALNPLLVPMSKVKDEVGLQFDKSHPDLPELTGPKSVEGAKGAEWFFTQFPPEHRMVVEALRGFKDYNENIAKHLEVLDDMGKTLKAIRDELKKK